MTQTPPNREAIQQAIDVLNRAHATDSTVLPALIAHRVPCNEALGDDSTVQCGMIDDVLMVGLLGIVNGLFGTRADTSGWIAADYDDDGTLIGFKWNVKSTDGG